MILRGLSFQ